MKGLISLRAIAATCTMLLAAQGCSLLSIETLPKNYTQLRQIRCTSNNVAPGLDVMSGIGGAVGAGVAAKVDKAPVALVSGIAGAFFFGSAIYGFTNTSKCAKAIDWVNAQALQAAAVGPQPVAVRAAPEPVQDAVLFWRDPRTQRAALRVLLERNGLRLAIFGYPENDAANVSLAVRRFSSRPTYESCRQLDLQIDKETTTLTARAAYSRGLDGSFTWEALRVPVSGSTLEAIVKADFAELRPCQDKLVLDTQARAQLGIFLQKWHELSAQAPPASPESASSPGAAPAAPPTTAPAQQAQPTPPQPTPAQPTTAPATAPAVP